jgi:diguanylate cyclase (GGDEF)-like protein
MAVVYASVVGWNRISRFVGLSFGGLATIFLVARLSTSIGNGNSTEEGTLILLGVTAVSVANARTIRLLIIPDRERLLSLEKENKELWNLSFRDQLTDVYNRRFAQEIGNKLVSHARRYHEQLHMFMIDIDYFKRVNDELSHAAGDEVLRSVAQKIQSHLRSSDYLARYGGEEFLVFAPLTDAEDAQFLANRIREDIASRRFDGVPWTISISIGVASLASDDTLETLVNKADKYLYSAKRGGRNRVAGY